MASNSSLKALVLLLLPPSKAAPLLRLQHLRQTYTSHPLIGKPHVTCLRHSNLHLKPVHHKAPPIAMNAALLKCKADGLPTRSVGRNEFTQQTILHTLEYMFRYGGKRVDELR